MRSNLLRRLTFALVVLAAGSTGLVLATDQPEILFDVKTDRKVKHI